MGDDAGLERTDNEMGLTTWPQVGMINQKNYYTEYLKRDDQILPLRLLLEERRNLMISKAKDKDRNFAKGGDADVADQDVDMDEDAVEEDEDDVSGEEIPGSKIVIIHPGSQNLRIGLASDALPKTLPMVVARKSKQAEFEEAEAEPLPKRQKMDDGTPLPPPDIFGEEFSTHYNQMCADLKVRMRANKRRVLPNSKDLITNYNKRTPPDTIPMHNDPLQIDWTEIPADPRAAPEYICGHAALRIPDRSQPRYRLYWPLRHGTYNEADYSYKKNMIDDISTIFEDALKVQLGLKKKREWGQYGCVFIIPDLYERDYVLQMLELLMKEFAFGKVALVQESLAATFGAGYIAGCVVDVGAQKTSVCCVEEGMCLENSRINLKFGGWDITETFIKMMLYDCFPYADINLKRRHDFLLAEELKTKFCTMNESEISPQLFDFHLRASGQDTRKYTFKTYDEPLLAPQGCFDPTIFDNSEKLKDRRKFTQLSRDIYEGAFNDPISAAQGAVIAAIAPPAPVVNGQVNDDANGGTPAPAIEKRGPGLLAKSFDPNRASSSAVGTPAPEDDETPAPVEEEKEEVPDISLRDDVLPIMALDQAILTSINHGARGEENKIREYLGQIMVIGGGAQVPGFLAHLEQRLKESRPGWAKDILIGLPPREMDAQGVIWKGGSVFGKLESASDSWIGQVEYDRLGARLLAYKCIWHF